MASSSTLLVQRERERLESIKAWQRPDMRRNQRWQVCRFVPPNRASIGLPVWLNQSCVRYGWIMVMEDTWRHLEVCVKPKAKS